MLEKRLLRVKYEIIGVAYVRKVIKETIETMDHLRTTLQFIGFLGSWSAGSSQKTSISSSAPALFLCSVLSAGTSWLDAGGRSSDSGKTWLVIVP